jgi:hypothetical protein
MKPISRVELQTAPARLEKEKARNREQELLGRIWAEQVYNQVRKIAESGHMHYQVQYPPTFTPIACAHAIEKLRQWFPDSDLILNDREKNAPVIISWAPRDLTASVNPLMGRR